MEDDKFYGLDLIYRVSKDDIKQESDIVIAFVHWFLTKNSTLRCLGIGEDVNK